MSFQIQFFMEIILKKFNYISKKVLKEKKLKQIFSEKIEKNWKKNILKKLKRYIFKNREKFYFSFWISLKTLLGFFGDNCCIFGLNFVGFLTMHLNHCTIGQGGP